MAIAKIVASCNRSINAVATLSRETAHLTYYYNSPHCAIVSDNRGVVPFTGTASHFRTVSMLASSRTRPKTVCFPSGLVGCGLEPIERRWVKMGEKKRKKPNNPHACKRRKEHHRELLEIYRERTTTSTHKLKNKNASTNLDGERRHT